MSRGRWLLLILFALFVLSMVIALVVMSFWPGSGPTFSSASVLHLHLAGPVAERAPDDPLLQAFGGGGTDFRDLIDAVAHARTNDDIEALYVEIDALGMGWAQAEELHDVVAQFSEDKPCVAFFDTAGEFGGANGSYYLASACQRIVLTPPGGVGINGLQGETPFVRGLLDKLEIKPEFGQRKEFKNAVNTYTETDFTQSHREATERLLSELHAELMRGISAGRELTEERVSELIDGGPYDAVEALEAGLVDDLMYNDQLMDELEQTYGESPFVSVDSYVDSWGRPYGGGSDSIALIYGVGSVMLGSSANDPFGGQVMGSDTVAGALRRARERDSIKAVVFRVDSPGGSYVASDLIRREVQLLSEAGKPIVVSMGNVAASGGYFVSMDSDYVLADRTTITGSIGVYAGKMVTRDFWNNKVGINWSSVQVGDNADFLSSQSEFDERGWERMNNRLDGIYKDFVGKAANSRGMEFDELEPFARGRVWSGRDALEHGLIDELGGLHRAIEIAAEKADLGDRFRVRVLPREPTFWEVVTSQGASSETRTMITRALTVGRELVRATSGEEALLEDRHIPAIR